MPERGNDIHVTALSPIIHPRWIVHEAFASKSDDS